jgi:hypothetical protein
MNVYPSAKEKKRMRRIIAILYIVFVILGHSGRIIVERKCNVKYFVPDTLISKFVFFCALTPTDGICDLIEGLRFGWDKTGEKVREEQDPNNYNKPHD